MRADEIKTALIDYHLDGQLKHEVIIIPELKMESGFGYHSDKRVDLFVMQTAPSKDCLRTAYEIKVSVADFKKEIRTPTKRWSGMMFSNRFYFATSAGLIDPDKIPADCGLIEVKDGRVNVVIKAPHRETAAPTWPFVASFFRSGMVTIARARLRHSKKEPDEQDFMPLWDGRGNPEGT